MKRAFDFSAALFALILLFIPLCLIALVVKITSKGPALHWSMRIGQSNQKFRMPKFRSMYVDTPQVATHLLQNSENHITPFGRVLRKTSLDELPQLLSVVVGDMSLVGPRPALFNQDDLIALRTERGIEKLRPGVTGWAQINGRDDLPIPIKVEFDHEYASKMSFLFDLKIILKTVMKVVKPEGIKH